MERERERRTKEHTDATEVLPESRNEFENGKRSRGPFNATIIVSGNSEDFQSPDLTERSNIDQEIEIAYESGREETYADEASEIAVDDQNDEAFSSSDLEDVEEYVDLLTNIEEQSEKVEKMKARLVKMWAKEMKSREEITVIRDLHTAIEQESAKLKSLIQRVIEVQQQHSAHRYEQFQTPTDSSEN